MSGVRPTSNNPVQNYANDNPQTKQTRSDKRSDIGTDKFTGTESGQKSADQSGLLGDASSSLKDLQADKESLKGTLASNVTLKPGAATSLKGGDKGPTTDDFQKALGSGFTASQAEDLRTQLVNPYGTLQDPPPDNATIRSAVDRVLERSGKTADSDEKTRINVNVQRTLLNAAGNT